MKRAAFVFWKTGRGVLIGVLGILLSLGLWACSAGTTPSPPSPDQVLETSALVLSPTVPATDTPIPSATPSPSLVILVAPAAADAAQVNAAQELFAELTETEGLSFETRSELSAAEIGNDVLLVAALPPDPGIADLAAVQPGVQFLAIGMPGLQPAANLSVVGSQGERFDQQGFLAGYTAALMTDDWRVGVISVSDTAPGLAARQGFLNGTVFYCGLCRSVYPPYIPYPTYYEFLSGSSQEEGPTAADFLIGQAVKTVYVYPGSVDEAVLEYLAQADVNLIGGTPPPASVRERWVATIQVDTLGAIREIWPRLLSGEGGLRAEAPLQITDINPTLLSPGRQRLVEGMLADLTAGYIDTGVDPLTGAPR